MVNVKLVGQLGRLVVFLASMAAAVSLLGRRSLAQPRPTPASPLQRLEAEIARLTADNYTRSAIWRLVSALPPQQQAAMTRGWFEIVEVVRATERSRPWQAESDTQCVIQDWTAATAVGRVLGLVFPHCLVLSTHIVDPAASGTLPDVTPASLSDGPVGPTGLSPLELRHVVADVLRHHTESGDRAAVVECQQPSATSLQHRGSVGHAAPTVHMGRLYKQMASLEVTRAVFDFQVGLLCRSLCTAADCMPVNALLLSALTSSCFFALANTESTWV